MKELVIVTLLALLVAGCKEEDKSRNRQPAVRSGQAHSGSENVRILIHRAEQAAGKNRSEKEGRIVFPRALALDASDAVYLLDRSGFVKKFSQDGAFLLSWELPQYSNGTPTGIAIDTRGNVLIADTHYSRVLVYSGDGKLIKSFGIYGTGDGQFTYVTDVAVDGSGNIYTCDYGRLDCVQKFTPEGAFIAKWDFSEVGGLNRPMALAIDSRDNIYIADSCNHRVVRIDTRGKITGIIGGFGKEYGKLRYPYDLALDKEDNLYVCEYGNSRVQKFSPEGEFMASWGRPGREPGTLWCPWAVALDSKDRVFVADTNNQRIIRLDGGIRN